jgi:hypothetical protein
MVSSGQDKEVRIEVGIGVVNRSREEESPKNRREKRGERREDDALIDLSSLLLCYPSLALVRLSRTAYAALGKYCQVGPSSFPSPSAKGDYARSFYDGFGQVLRARRLRPRVSLRSRKVLRTRSLQRLNLASLESTCSLPIAHDQLTFFPLPTGSPFLLSNNVTSLPPPPLPLASTVACLRKWYANSVPIDPTPSCDTMGIPSTSVSQKSQGENGAELTTWMRILASRLFERGNVTVLVWICSPWVVLVEIHEIDPIMFRWNDTLCRARLHFARLFC